MAGLSSASNNRTLTLIGVSIVSALLLVWLMWPSPPSGFERVGGEAAFSLPARLVPVWDVPALQEGGAPPVEGDEILLYLDTSHSMAGFLPPGSSTAEGPTLRTVAQLVPGHLLNTGSGTTLWHTVDDRVSPPTTHSPRFEQKEFVGSRSDLDDAVRRGLAALDAGRARSMVLITDLVATSDAKGAMGAARPLVDWSRSPSVRDGHFDVGILGVRLPYWGAVTPRCSAPRGLGCWYSEHADRYQPLSAVARRPLYFLIVGRSGGTERDDAATSAVERAGQALRRAIAELGVETTWELLTAGSRPREASLTCAAHKAGDEGGPQYALFRDRTGVFQCRRDEAVRLSCLAELGADGAAAAAQPLGVDSAVASWPEVATAAVAGRLVATVDCAALRRAPPANPLDLDITVVPPAAAEDGLWKGWSARSDEVEDQLTSTLQLDLFLDSARLRPTALRLETDEPVLRPRASAPIESAGGRGGPEAAEEGS